MVLHQSIGETNIDSLAFLLLVRDIKCINLEEEEEEEEENITSNSTSM